MCGDPDGDGLCTRFESQFGDTDGDTTLDEDDSDDDGDGQPTASEDADPNGDGDPRDAADADRDGQPDYRDPGVTIVDDPWVVAEQKISPIEGGGPALDPYDRWGQGLASVGDIDGDGVVDLAVGSQSDDDGGSDRGAVYVLLMNADGTVRAEQKISDTTGGLGASLDDVETFGRAVAGAGDLDGDGVPDLVVGAYFDDDGGTSRGAAYALFMNTDGTVRAEQKISAATGGLVGPLDDNDLFGASVAGLGDLDGDGVPDLAVGAISDDDGGADQGAVYVLFMNPDGTVRAEQKISETIGGFTGPLDGGDRFGEAVAAVGDVDGDGTIDLAVTAGSDDDGSSGAGAVYVLFMNPDGTVRAEQKISATVGGLTGPLQYLSKFGAAVSGIGDLDDDGTPDLVVGAAYDSDGGTGRGSAFVLLLNPDGTVRAEQKLSATDGGLSSPLDDNDFFGSSVASLGDLDGDGTFEIAVGAIFDADGGTGAGAIYVLDLASPVAVVNDTGDADDAVPGNGLCDTGGTNVDGARACTLRAAITETNANAELNRITFAIPTADPNHTTGIWTIAPAAALPATTATIELDATTQPGWTTSPVVVLDGSGLAGGEDGLQVAGVGTVVRGLAINGFPGDGIELQGSGGHTVAGNHLGLDSDGTTAAGNGGHGVRSTAGSNGNTVGGPLLADRNVIAANGGAGVSLAGDDGIIRNNHVGTDRTGGFDRGNATGGIQIQGVARALIRDNVIAGNGGDGLAIGGNSTDGVVTGNRIGVGAGGTTALGNDGSGIALAAGAGTGTRIGGATAGDANMIANNADRGIAAQTDGPTTILANRIHSNGNLGIDLGGDGVTANDAGDPDTGPNGLLNHPVIDNVRREVGDLEVAYRLDLPAGSYRIEFFGSAAADTSGHGEGETLLASVDVVHGGAGTEPFATVFPDAGPVVVTATATVDLGGGSYGATSEFSAAATINSPPTFDAPLTGLTSAEGEIVTVPIPASDVDLDTLNWVAVGLPPGLAMNPATGEIGGQISATAAAGSPYAVTITVDDGRGDSDTDAFAWTITDTNRPPLLDPLADVTVDEGVAVAVPAVAVDLDLPVDTLVYSATGLPAGATINPTTGLLTWTPSEAQGPGAYPITVTVTDNGSPAASASQTVTVTVDEIPTAPTIAPIPDQQSGEGGDVLVIPTATDPDLPAETLTWSAAGLPPGLSIDPVTGAISGTVDGLAGAGSPYATSVTVDDGTGNVVTEAFTWSITDTNRNPIFFPIGDVTVTEGQVATFTATAADPDGPGDTVTLSVSDLPAGASFDPATGIFTWQTTEVDGPSSVIVTVTATDDGVPSLDASWPVEISVEEENAAPVVDGPNVISRPEQQPLSITMTATDEDVPPNAVRWSATGLPAGASIDPITGALAWTPTEAQGPGRFPITVIATDDGSPPLSSSQQLAIIVTEVNTRPTLAPMAQTSIVEGTRLDTEVSAIDTEGDTIRYELINAPDGMTVDPVTGAVRWTPSEAQGPDTYLVTVVADDGESAGTTLWNVSVGERNQPPVLFAPPDMVALEGQPFSVGLRASDLDLPPNALRYELIDGPAGMEVDPLAGTVTWTPDLVAGSVVETEVRVVDGAVPEGTATARFAIEVIPSRLGFTEVPVAVGDDVIAEAGTPITIDVLANDTGRDLEVFDVGQPSEGLATLVDGEVRFIPDPDFVGVTAFSYQVRNRDWATAFAIVTVDVRPPVLLANDDAIATRSGRVVEYDILANDLLRRPPDELTITTAAGGTVEVLDNGRIRYVPDESFVGEDTLIYRVVDSFGSEATATISITVDAAGLVETAPALLDVDVPTLPPRLVEPVPISVTELGGSTWESVRAFSIPLVVLVIAILWFIGLAMALGWFGGGSVRSITNTPRDHEVTVGELDRPAELFRLRHDHDLLWTSGRRRRRGGRWYRRVETPAGPGWVEDDRLAPTVETYRRSAGGAGPDPEADPNAS
ncbi:MAG: putative Ig domain-containing protein [Actinomycetota bacterium]